MLTIFCKTGFNNKKLSSLFELKKSARGTEDFLYRIFYWGMGYRNPFHNFKNKYKMKTKSTYHFVVVAHCSSSICCCSSEFGHHIVSDSFVSLRSLCLHALALSRVPKNVNQTKIGTKRHSDFLRFSDDHCRQASNHQIEGKN